MLAAIKRGYFLCIVFLRIPGRNLSVNLRILPFEICVNGKKKGKKSSLFAGGYLSVGRKNREAAMKKMRFPSFVDWRDKWIAGGEALRSNRRLELAVSGTGLIGVYPGGQGGLPGYFEWSG